MQSTIHDNVETFEAAAIQVHDHPPERVMRLDELSPEQQRGFY